jgi:hypothetical protein
LVQQLVLKLVPGRRAWQPVQGLERKARQLTSELQQPVQL